MDLARLGPIEPNGVALEASIRSASAAAGCSTHPRLKPPETDFQPTFTRISNI
jgi:hypothetical protein